MGLDGVSQVLGASFNFAPHCGVLKSTTLLRLTCAFARAEGHLRCIRRLESMPH